MDTLKIYTGQKFPYMQIAVNAVNDVTFIRAAEKKVKNKKNKAKCIVGINAYFAA